MSASSDHDPDNSLPPTLSVTGDGGASTRSWQIIEDERRPPPDPQQPQLDEQQQLSIATIEESAPIELDDSEVSTVADIELDADIEDNLSIGSAAASAASVPIPAFVNDLRVSDMSPDILRILALKLDLHGSGTAYNWEQLAANLGMPLDQIWYLRERCVHPTSPTVEMLQQFGDVNLGYLLKLLRDKLKRFDVLIELEPYIMSLKTSAIKKGQSERSDTMDSGISGPINDEPGPSHRPDPHYYAQSRVRNNLFDLVGSNHPASSYANRLPPINGINVHPHLGSTIAPVPRPALPQGVAKEFLVTFYPDSDHHVRYVRWLCKNLQKFGANVVREDKLIESSAATDFTGALTDAFNRAAQVIVVLSDEYSQCVRPKTDGGALLSQRAQACRYLYRLMDAEYLTNSCINYRFRPVLFPFVPSTAVPSGWVRNTIVYQWPGQQDNLFRMLFESTTNNAGGFDLAGDSAVLQTQ